MCGSQRAISWNQFSPPTVWVMGKRGTVQYFIQQSARPLHCPIALGLSTVYSVGMMPSGPAQASEGHCTQSVNLLHESSRLMVQGGTACPARTISVTEAPGKPSILILCTFSDTTKDREYRLPSVKPLGPHVSRSSYAGITDGLTTLSLYPAR